MHLVKKHDGENSRNGVLKLDFESHEQYTNEFIVDYISLPDC